MNSTNVETFPIAGGGQDLWLTDIDAMLMLRVLLGVRVRLQVFG